jgi:hypothetical protein
MATGSKVSDVQTAANRRCDDHLAQGLETQLQRLMGVPNLYVLFTSGDDPDSNLPWCPDCVRANPAVAAAFAAVEGATLLVCKVPASTTSPRILWAELCGAHRTCTPTCLVRLRAREPANMP